MKYRIQFDLLLSAWIKNEIFSKMGFFLFFGQASTWKWCWISSLRYTHLAIKQIQNQLYQGQNTLFENYKHFVEMVPSKKQKNKKNSFYTMIPTGRFSSSTLELYGPESTWEPMNSTKIFHILTWALCIAEFFCTSISLLD